MRKCPCGGLHSESQQFEACRRRAAFHEAGHILMYCLTTLTDRGLQGVLLDRYSIWPLQGDGAASGVGLPPGGRTTDGWQEVVVRLAGHAAEELAFGEHLAGHRTAQDDWIRAERILRGLGMYEHARDAFLIAKELLAHHRPALERLVEALLASEELDGGEVRVIFESYQRQGPGGSEAETGARRK